MCLTNGSYVANKCETDETSAACTDIANEIQDITTGRDFAWRCITAGEGMISWASTHRAFGHPPVAASAQDGPAPGSVVVTGEKGTHRPCLGMSACAR